MDRSSQTSSGYKLESQLREAYGRIVYTQTAHNKIVHRLLKRNSTIKMGQILLSAVTTGSFITLFVSETTKTATISGGICSLLLLILNSYAKSFELVETAQKHRSAADALWKIREEYVTVLTDFEDLDANQIREKRDELQERTSKVYEESPSTDEKGYKAAQKSLKTEEEQTFSEKEIDLMLTNSIRRNKNTNNKEER